MELSNSSIWIAASFLAAVMIGIVWLLHSWQRAARCPSCGASAVKERGKVEQCQKCKVVSRVGCMTKGCHGKTMQFQGIKNGSAIYFCTKCRKERGVDEKKMMKKKG